MQEKVGNFLEQLFLCASNEVEYFDDKPESITESVFLFSNSGHRFVS